MKRPIPLSIGPGLEQSFENETFHSSILEAGELHAVSKLSFRNCTFESDFAIEKCNNASLVVEFWNCNFEGDVFLTDSALKECHFWIKRLHVNKINILRSTFAQLSFTSNDLPIFGEINIHECAFTKSLSCTGLKLAKGKFVLSGCNSGAYKADFRHSRIENAFFSNSFLGTEANFEALRILQKSKFAHCTFGKSFFPDAHFGHHTAFLHCDFTGTTLFNHSKTVAKSKLDFESCKFSGFTHFGSMRAFDLSVKYTTFEKPASFVEAVFDKITFLEIKFEKGAYFDDLKIIAVADNTYLKNKPISEIKSWKHTLRLIKQELQKTENTIDFNRFRSYELAAHYEELDWGWQSGFKDKFILFSSKWSTDFGKSWRRALAFTLLGGLFWYTALFAFLYFKRPFPTDANHFFTGAFRFFLVTDFYNPLNDGRLYLEDAVSWLIFVAGKIFIAFGLYEMVQSFRKFKA